MKKSMFIIAFTILFGTTTSIAASPRINNTNTCLASQESDGSLAVVDAFVWRHLYGEEVVVTLAVRNIDPEKEIWIFDRFASYDFNASKRAIYVENENDFDTGGTRALWLETHEDNRDLIKVKFNATALGYMGSILHDKQFSFYVKTGDRQFQTTAVTLKKCDQ